MMRKEANNTVGLFFCYDTYMNVEELVRRYIREGMMMQVATIKGDQPWVCTVYYVPDEELNLYWISTPERRHSREIAGHPKVAGAIPVKHAPDGGVVGLQFEGQAQRITDQDEIQKIMKLYVNRYTMRLPTGDGWYRDFIAGKNPYKLYRIKPSLFVLFDEETFPATRDMSGNRLSN